MDYNAEAVETLRQLTLQIMLIAAGVFGLVGGFVSSSEKRFVRRAALGWALSLFALSALCGYIVHGVLISLLSAQKFDAFHPKLVTFGVMQIALFLIGGGLFTWFVVQNIRNEPGE
jgi:hypothetical protein